MPLQSYSRWRVVRQDVKMRSDADLKSPLIDEVDLPLWSVVEQIAPILDIGGMERPTNPRTPLEKSAIENGRRCVSHRLLAAKRMNLL